MRSSHARRRRWRTLLPPINDRRPRDLDRARAIQAVAVALRDGRLEKLPCEVCQAVEGVEAVHDDPAAPLDVRWRCPAHMQGRP